MDNKLNWVSDNDDTEYWAEKITFKDFLGCDPKAPSSQYGEREGEKVMGLNKENWKNKRGIENFPSFCDFPGRKGVSLPNPCNIIRCFDQDYYLQGMVLVIIWGNMRRKTNEVFNPKNKPRNENENIQNILKEAKKKIVVDCPIDDAWYLLEKNLGWRNVFISKVLHFLSRSAGFVNNPPVPIDNAIIFDRVWQNFIRRVEEKKKAGDKHDKPKSWNSGGICGYLRYMTLINIWAKQKNWSTTDIETTLYQKFSEQ
ncbi:MAG: hypothetical protein WC947_04720 [Elusimicrobiota bacterium]